MCQYCNCNTPVEDGFVGECIGGGDLPLYILKCNNPIEKCLFWLAESHVFYYKDKKGRGITGKEFYLAVPIHYCPNCGVPLI